jgi:uncharacterized protein
MIRFFKITLVALVVSYLLLMVVLVFFQKQIVFQAKKLPQEKVFEFDVPFQERWFEVGEGIRLNALYFRTDTAKRKGIVLYHHGNADNLARWGQYAEPFVRAGYDLLMYDYRGYGKSSGEPSEQALYADARLVYEQIRKDFQPSQIIIYGRSLGSGVATHLAAEVPARMLLLETPYTRMPAVSGQWLGSASTEQLLIYQFPNDSTIRKVGCPIHIFHGTADAVVPYQHSLELCAILQKSPAQILTTIPEGGHKNLSEFATYRKALDSCLTGK